jgi:hypothetical protein
MNNLKKSIMIFVAISSVSVVSAMATPDAEGHLENWYKKEYQKSVEKTLPIMTDGVLEINNSMLELLRDVSSSITFDSIYLNTIKGSNSEIETFQKSFLSRLNESKAELSDIELNDFTEEKVKDLNENVTTEVESILQEILEE